MLVILSLFAGYGVMTAQAAEIDAASIEYWKDDVAYYINGEVLRDCLAYDTYGYKAPSPDKRYTMLDKNGKATTWSGDPLKDFYGISTSDKKGWVEFRATVPEDYSGEEIIVTVIDALGEKTQISLYKENTFLMNKQLPTGDYTVLSIKVAGDHISRYTAKADKNTFYLLEDAAATLVNIVVEDGISYPEQDYDENTGNNGSDDDNTGDNGQQGETTPPTDPSNPTDPSHDPENNETTNPTENENNTENEHNEEKEVSIVVEVISIVGLVILVAIIAFVIYKSR